MNQTYAYINPELLDRLEKNPELLDKIEKLQVLALQPGDILVATTPSGFPQEAAVRLREQLLQHVPGHQVFVIANGIELAALRP